MINIENTDLNGHSLIPFNSFLKANGRSVSCGWRWRKKGFITTINISGRLYVTPEEAERFQQRAAAGEFAKGTADNGTDLIYDDPVTALPKAGKTGNLLAAAEKSNSKEVK